MVAFLAEGVDRNTVTIRKEATAAAVAFLAEGVDRNVSPPSKVPIRDKSPSSRRAWIEIPSTKARTTPTTSPSSRRAWIEIDSMPCRNLMKPVAFLAEGVDRNNQPESCVHKIPVAFLAEGVDRNTCLLYTSDAAEKA